MAPERRMQDMEAPSRSDFGTRRVEQREPPTRVPVSNAPTGVWQRAQFVEKKADEPAPAPPAKAGGYVPPHLRGAQSGPARSAPEPQRKKFIFY